MKAKHLGLYTAIETRLARLMYGAYSEGYIDQIT